jgi:ferric-dicitrate binding protein FerR (iron transport regulator)
MTERCNRWMELSDRQLLGDELAELEREYIRAHELECLVCGREAAVLRELRPPLLHAVPSEEDVRRLLLQADLPELEQARPEPSPQARPSIARRLPPRRLAAAAAMLALVAGLALLIGLKAPAPAEPSLAAAPTTGSAAALARPPAFLSKVTEDTCGPLVDGIVLCVTAGTEIGRVQLEGPRRSVELRRGRAVASLDSQPRGSSFSIATRAGEVKAIGTVFSVELAEDGTAYARVTRGRVLVHATSAQSEQSLLAGQQLMLGAATASALPLREAERDLELVARWTSMLGFGEAQAESSLEPSEEAKGPEPVADDPEPQRTTQDELSYARQLRARGLFTRAAEIYRSVHARSPSSESGRAALMALASLQLSSLNDPKAALASFDRYLAAGGGPLRQQADYGRIRALRSLGRTAEELKATRAFIERYPKAPEARLLRERSSKPDGR